MKRDALYVPLAVRERSHVARHHWPAEGYEVRGAASAATPASARARAGPLAWICRTCRSKHRDERSALSTLVMVFVVLCFLAGALLF